jgi:phosphate transport system substrate-binding protein
MDIGARRMAAWGLGGLAVALSLAAMVVMWRGGGLQLLGKPAARTVEACDATIDGSPTITARLVPALAAAFLRQAGYDVDNLASKDGVVVVTGRRGAIACTVTIRASNSTAGLTALAAGETLMAVSIRPISERDELMFAAAGAGDLVSERTIAERQIGLDAVAVVVNAANPVREIDIGAVRDIGVGITQRWSDLGGPDEAIRVLAPVDGNMPRDFPNDVVTVRHPAFERMSERVDMFEEEQALLTALRDNTGAFSIASAAFFSGAPGVKVLPLRNGAEVYAPTPDAIAGRRYPLVRRLFLYARPRDARDNAFVREFIAFATSTAADPLVREAGFFAMDRRLAEAGDPVAGRCIAGTVEAAAVAGAVRGASRVGEPLRFEGNSLRLDSASRALVEELAPILLEQTSRGAAGVLVGHADVTGESDKNRSVALRRAIAVRDAFEARGVVGLSTESAGEMCIEAENVSDAGRRSNQRVELWVRPPAGAAPRT